MGTYKGGWIFFRSFIGIFLYLNIRLLLYAWICFPHTLLYGGQRLAGL